MEAPAWLKPAILGGIAGAIATIVVGFVQGSREGVPAWSSVAPPRPQRAGRVMREGRNAALAGHFTTWWRMVPPPRLVEDVAVAREFPGDQHADFPVRVPVRATFEKSRCAFRLRDNRERTMTDTPMSAGSDETAGPEEEEFMERVIAPALLELEKWLGHIPTEAEFSE